MKLGVKKGTLKQNISVGPTAASQFKFMATLDAEVDNPCPFRLEDLENLNWCKFISMQYKVRLFWNNKNKIDCKLEV